MLRAGARWRIGLGRNVGIWNEPWLPDARDPTIQTLHVCGLESAKECSPKTVNGEEWDVDILNDLFCVRDRELILKILPKY